MSGVGDDANPCSRTAPCKTFGGAISKTAAKGEINCLDPGGFGGVTITKSLAIKCQYTEGGVLVSGTNAIVVNAAATDDVTLRGLDINGIGTGLNGIRILQADTVKILDTEIFGFVRNGVDIEPVTGALTKVKVVNSHIHDNGGNGVLVAPAGTGAARVGLRNNQIDDNGCGVTAARFGPDPLFNYTVRCGTQNADADTAASVVNAFDNFITDSLSNAVFANGSSATIRMGRNMVTGTISGPALSVLNSGSILSWGNNMVAGNPGGDGAATGALTAARVRRN